VDIVDRTDDPFALAVLCQWSGFNLGHNDFTVVSSERLTNGSVSQYDFLVQRGTAGKNGQHNEQSGQESRKRRESGVHGIHLAVIDGRESGATISKSSADAILSIRMSIGLVERPEKVVEYYVEIRGRRPGR
jgi:hypothetical protein